MEDKNKMDVKKETVGVTDDNREIYLYTIQNSKGMRACVTNYGAILVKLYVCDKNENPVDVVLGYDDFESYKHNFDMLGTTVGRNVNRIEHGRFVIDNEIFQLEINENDNNIHSHMDHGFHKVLWDSEVINDSEIKFSYISKDGENGFPGNLTVSVTYTVSENNELILSYEGISDKKTIINITNHSYFNLAGHNKGNIFETVVSIEADYYTPVGVGIIPNGKILPVSGTPFDFRVPKQIGCNIKDMNEQINLVSGYDHNFVLRNYNGKIRKVATAVSPETAIKMEVYTDLPGLQFYTGNTTRDIIGKDHYLIKKYCGFCMESQHFPNSINISHFPQPVFDAGERYVTKTIYSFSTEVDE